MKKHLLICFIAAMCFGLCSNVMANVTLPESGTDKPEAVKVKDNSKDPDFFLEDWLYWLCEHLFGWDWDDDVWVYRSNSGNGGSGGDGGTGGGIWDDGGSGDGGSGDGGWGDGGSGDGGSGDGGFGDGGSGDGGSGDGGSGDGGSGDGGSGDGGCGDGGSGDGGWNDGGSGGGGSGGGSDPVQPIPAPGAVVLGGIGMSLISWLRRRHIL